MRSKKYKSKTGQRASAMMLFSMQRQKKRLSPRNEKATLSSQGSISKREQETESFSQGLLKNLVHHYINIINRAEGRISFICLC